MVNEAENKNSGSAASGQGMDLTADQKVGIAQHISKNFIDGTMSDFEQKLAHKVFLILASDTELKVRKTLAERLKSCHELPHDVAVKLASDVIEVAQPILANSTVLNDEDLMEIIKTSKSVAHKLAISVRETISPSVTGALVNSGEDEVIKTLVTNKGAEFTEQIIMQVLDNFAGDNTILESLVKRGDVPLAAVEKMVTMVSDELKEELVTKHNLDRGVAGKMVDSSREIATLGLLSMRSPDVDLQEVIDQMFKKNKLTSSIVLRSLCVGDLRFFQYALARLAGVPFLKAKSLMQDRSEKGFKALYRAANMPMGAFEAVKVVLIMAIEETEDGKKMPDNYQRRMMERIYEEGYTNTIENMSYIMGVLSTSMQAHKSALN